MGRMLQGSVLLRYSSQVDGRGRGRTAGDRYSGCIDGLLTPALTRFSHVNMLK
jgi:hypothetical protein